MNYQEITNKWEIKGVTKLWYGNIVKNKITGKQGKIQKFIMVDDTLCIILRGDKGKVQKDTSQIDLWELVEVSERKYVKHGIFRLSELPLYEKIRDTANVKIKTGDITLSKVARDRDGDEIENHGTIWYSCTDEDFNIFRRILQIHFCEKSHNIRRITKAEMMELPFGANYFMMYAHNTGWNVEVIECIKIHNKKESEFITWNLPGDTSFQELKQSLDLVVVDGSFIPSHSTIENETGYFYVRNETGECEEDMLVL